MTRAELKGEAKELIKGKVWKVFWFTLVVTAIVPFIFSFLSSFVSLVTGTRYASVTECQKTYPPTTAVVNSTTKQVSDVCTQYKVPGSTEVIIPNVVVSIIFGVITFIFEAILVYGLLSEMLKFVRKKGDPAIGEAFSVGFANWGRAVWAMIRVEFFTVLWTLLFIIPGIIKAFAYSQTMFVLADNPKMTAKEAQAKSIEIMDGHKMDYFVLCLSFIPWLLLVIVTFGIASIYVGPYVDTTLTNYYKQISGKKK